ncbi:MAG: ThiF family adenylyltransferase [Planctomycetes bacterium]|nr:ThiF family adenylyltransferase [Planctomycetota bacterium]
MSSRRFERQARFAPLGQEGQQRLAESRVLLVGVGALGGVLAQALTRAGVGQLVLADRDLVEETNLPRQVLFEDRHAREGTPKVEAARETLTRIGGPTSLEVHAVHVDAANLPDLAAGCDLVLDGTDNLATRYLINDHCVATGTPWIYGGVVGGAGLVLPVLPEVGPCLRCVFREPPPPGTLPTCDTAGVILPAVGLVASLQAGLALRCLAAPAGLEPALVELDAWSGEVRRLRAQRDPACPCCGAREFPWLERGDADHAVSLCGRNTVQVQRPGPAPDLDRLATRLAAAGASVRRAGPLLRAEVEEVALTVFPDGRTLIEGTDDCARAEALYDRWLGG